jgi:exopolysaccharide biosynthesis polyprenyl glycosylphosphotransferase
MSAVVRTEGDPTLAPRSDPLAGLRPPPSVAPDPPAEATRVGDGRRGSAALKRSSVETYLQFCRVSDTATALATLFILFVIDNLGRLPTGLDEFLGTRLSVKNCLLVVVFSAGWFLTCRWAGLYNWTLIRNRRKERVRVWAAVTAGTVVAVIFPLTSVSGAFRINVLLPFLGLGTALMLLGRRTLRSMAGLGASQPRNIMIVGTGPIAREFCSVVLSGGQGADLNVVGFVDSIVQPQANPPRCVCAIDELERFLMTHDVDDVLIALPVKSCYAEIQRTIQVCERVGVSVKYSASFFNHAREQPRIEHHSSGPLMTVPAAPDGPRLLLKRGIDVIGAALGLLVLSPLLLAVAVAIKLTSRGPILFTQMRYGRGRRRFRMYKFRTMVQDAEALQAQVESLNEQQGPIFKIRRDPRVTWLGSLLRRTSIDELPQLWNVLRGDMSLVGPRPMSLRDVNRFSEAWLMRRFSVYPGITGLWQVSGRSELPFDDWIRLDLSYIDRWSLGLDLAILARTVPAVLSGRGAA